MLQARQRSTVFLYPIKVDRRPCSRSITDAFTLHLSKWHVVILQVRRQELVAVCDRCLQPVDEATFQSNMQRLEVRHQLLRVSAVIFGRADFCCWTHAVTQAALPSCLAKLDAAHFH